MNPKSMSFALLVETPLTVGLEEDVLVAVLGSAPLASQGEAVFAPLTPKATSEASFMIKRVVTPSLL